MVGQYKNGQVYIELRPRCPKCKKEFMLDIRRFVPGSFHSCYACGTVVQFDPALAKKLQEILRDLEGTIGDVLENFSSSGAG